MTRSFLVSGRVQGVGFRYFVAREAGLLTLTGWVRNLPDGRVEVVACGETGLLDRLEKLLAQGPGMARVSWVETAEISDDTAPSNGFLIK